MLGEKEGEGERREQGGGDGGGGRRTLKYKSGWGPVQPVKQSWGLLKKWS